MMTTDRTFSSRTEELEWIGTTLAKLFPEPASAESEQEYLEGLAARARREAERKARRADR